jgi:hypothetical protein
MTAQAYFGKNEKWMIRVFEKNEAIAELPLKEPSDESADLSLKRMRLRRNSSWTSHGWGKQATVQWVRSKKVIQREIKEKIKEIENKFTD